MAGMRKPFLNGELTMPTNEKPVWFAAKRSGWGWSFPCAWQGWVVFVVWLLLLVATAFLTLPGHFGFWIASVVALGGALVMVCVVKGERPRWRWGGSERRPGRSLAERLAELDELRRRELVTESEHAAMRQKIVKGFGSEESG